MLPLLAAWLLVARLTGCFLPTWLAGVPLGIAVRMVVLSHYRWRELSFLAVALVFIGAIAGALHFVHPRRTSRHAPQNVR